MDIKEALQLTGQHMRAHGLIEKGWKFRWDNAKKRFGTCSCSKKVITLSKVLVPYIDREEVEDTILHEIAHALVGCSHGHDRVWKAKCREIGARPERCGKDLPNYIKGALSNYIATCPNGHVRYRNRKPKHDVSCGKCCRTYNPKYKLVWEKL